MSFHLFGRFVYILCGQMLLPEDHICIKGQIHTRLRNGESLELQCKENIIFPKPSCHRIRAVDDVILCIIAIYSYTWL